MSNVECRALANETMAATVTTHTSLGGPNKKKATRIGDDFRGVFAPLLHVPTYVVHNAYAVQRQVYARKLLVARTAFLQVNDNGRCVCLCVTVLEGRVAITWYTSCTCIQRRRNKGIHGTTSTRHSISTNNEKCNSANSPYVNF